MSEQERKARRRWALTMTNPSGDEVSISLHPISLARLLAEAIEEATLAACRRRGHDSGREDYCGYCGISLPDDGSDYHSWMPDAYRTIRKKSEPTR